MTVLVALGGAGLLWALAALPVWWLYGRLWVAGP